ncbi:hypothetical protein JGU66_28100 [Myxococcaceae bacterium JPH2]|nr:hypothetical protein [Myxococcaceae bacterium JPH2]
MLASLVVVLGFLSGAWGMPAHAEPLLSDLELNAALEELGGQDLPAEKVVRSEKGLSLLEVEPPRLLLRGALKEHLAPQAVVQRFAQTYGLPPEAARGVLTAVLLAEKQARIEDASAARALQSLERAARLAPNSLVPAATLISNWTLMVSPRALGTLRALLLVAPDPVARALKLSPAAEGPISRSLWTFALGENPELLPQALESLHEEADSLDGCAFLLSALEAPSFPEQTLSRNEQRVALMRCFFNEELPDLALQQLDALPEAARQGLRGQMETRLNIAAAFLARGDKTQARAWLPNIAELPGDDSDGTMPELYEPRSQTKLLDALLSPSPHADAFSLLEQRRWGLWRYPWTRFVAEAFAKQYPGEARRTLERATGRTYLLGEDVMAGADATLPFVERALRAIRAESVWRETDFRQALAALPSVSRLGAASAHEKEALGQRLDAARLGVFTERTEAAEAPASTAADAVVTVPLKSLKLPQRFEALLAQRLSRTRMVVVAWSRTLDPSGEVDAGGYWVLFSDDNGHTWSEPLYTGLRRYEPFVLAVDGHGPLLVGDTLRFEVVRCELIHESITFPPVGLRFREDSRQRVLEAKLERLRLDSDHDSLPDILEARMLLDPNLADTDGDGLSDAVDPLPRSARTAGSQAARAEILTRFFAAVDSEVFPSSPESKTQKGKTRGARIPLEKTLFVKADLADLEGVTTPGRVIAVSPAEEEVLRQRLGAFYLFSFDLFFNLAGDRALLKWSAGWIGGSFLASQNSKGKWVLTRDEDWVT